MTDDHKPRRLSWADVAPGDRVTYVHGGETRRTIIETVPCRHNANEKWPIIRIERPEYRDVTPREQEPEKLCVECGQPMSYWQHWDNGLGSHAFVSAKEATKCDYHSTGVCEKCE